MKIPTISCWCLWDSWELLCSLKQWHCLALLLWFFYSCILGSFLHHFIWYTSLDHAFEIPISLNCEVLFTRLIGHTQLMNWFVNFFVASFEIGHLLGNFNILLSQCVFALEITWNIIVTCNRIGIFNDNSSGIWETKKEHKAMFLSSDILNHNNYSMGYNCKYLTFPNTYSCPQEHTVCRLWPTLHEKYISHINTWCWSSLSIITATCQNLRKYFTPWSQLLSEHSLVPVSSNQPVL